MFEGFTSMFHWLGISSMRGWRYAGLPLCGCFDDLPGRRSAAVGGACLMRKDGWEGRADE